MSRHLFIFLMLCLFTVTCSINTSLYIPIGSTGNNNNAEVETTPSSMSNPILGPEYGYFANGYFIAGELKVTIEEPNGESYDGLTIINTFDGTEPTITNGEIYTGPISVLCEAGESFTVKAIALTDKLASNVSTKKYTCADVNLHEPTILRLQQYYEKDALVEIQIINPNSANIANIKTMYTTDGSVPTTSNGILYEGPFEITGSADTVVIIRAITFLDDGTSELPVSTITRQDFIFLANQ